MVNSNNVYVLGGVRMFLNNDLHAQLTQFAASTLSNSRHMCRKQLVISGQTDQFKWRVWVCGVISVLLAPADVFWQVALFRTCW